MLPSESEAVAEQVRVVDVPMPELGLMAILPTLGARLAMVAEAEPVAVPPSSSVAVTVQMSVFPGELIDALRLSVLLSPKTVPDPLVHR